MKLLVIFSSLMICFLPVSTWGECIKGDCVNGQGTMTFPDGSKYEGEWKDRHFNGQGALSLPDGGSLIGQWKNGQFNGQGTIHYKYGIYEGRWKDGMKNGQGIMTFHDGSKYEGQWKDDKRDGQGVMTFHNGSIYKGQWKDDRIDGQGDYTYPNGGKYVGQWKNGKKHGQGTYTGPDNYKLMCEFKDGKPNGHGIMMFPDGSRYEGEWKDGKFIKKDQPVPEEIAGVRSAAFEGVNETITPPQSNKAEGTPIGLGPYPYTIQVSSFQSRENANNLAIELKNRGLPAFTCPAQIPGKGVFHRIFIGFYQTLKDAQKAALRLRGQKDFSPTESKMPYAIQVGTSDSDQDLIKLENDLLSKAYLAYSISDNPDNHKARLLIGAFKTEEEAVNLAKTLQEEGFKAKVVKR